MLCYSGMSEKIIIYIIHEFEIFKRMSLKIKFSQKPILQNCFSSLQLGASYDLQLSRIIKIFCNNTYAIYTQSKFSHRRSENDKNKPQQMKQKKV